jgi:penicillin-binding protein 1C
LSLLRQKGLISQSDEEAARREVLLGERFSPPRKAFHLAAFLLDPPQARRWRWGAPGFAGQVTSLDPVLQDNLEKNLLLALKTLPDEVNGAGLLVSNQSGLVLAYLGGVRKAGPTFHVDNLRSKGSSGSALKPFLYLAALAETTLGPAELLAERARETLGDSKSKPGAQGQAPALELLRLIGQARALEVLKSVGFSINSDNDYVNSLIFENLETSMLELAGAYATLARGGQVVRPGFDPKGQYLGPQLFPQQAVCLINQSLCSERAKSKGPSAEALAFESGLSPNQSGAWLAVYDPAHTLILWLGDPSGQSHQGLLEAAGLLEVGVKFMGELGPKTLWPEAPEALE